jgi:mRNA m6A methyltransferase non-catalytic subunit
VYIKNFADRDGKVRHGGGGRNPPPDAPHLVVTTPEIENLRPKSPQKNQQGQMGSSISTNRRPGTNTTQNVVTVVGSQTMMPAQWASTPVGGFGMPEGGVSAAPVIYERREQDELEEHDEHETQVNGHRCLHCV